MRPSCRPCSLGEVQITGGVIRVRWTITLSDGHHVTAMWTSCRRCWHGEVYLGNKWCDPRADDNYSVQLALFSSNRVDILRALLAWRGPDGECCDPRAGHNYRGYANLPPPLIT